MRKLKILHIVCAKEWGGGEACAAMMCRESMRRGHMVYMVVDETAPDFKARLQAIGTVFSLPLGHGHNPVTIQRLRDILQKFCIDVVHTHTGKMIPMVVAAKAFLPSVHLMAFRHNVLPNKQDFIHRYLYAKVDAFICVSKAVYDMQRNTMQDVYRDRVRLVYNGIDTAMYNGYQPCFYQPPLIVGYAGRIDASKGIEYLLEAVAMLPMTPLQLYIAGEDHNEYGDFLKGRIERLGIGDRVQWLGFQENMCQFYDRINVFVMPSLIREAFGLVLCEAMYCERPVIATGSGAQTEIVEPNVNGVLVETGSAEDIAQALLFFAKKPQYIENYGKAGHRKVAENFTMELWAKKMEELYAQYIE